MKKPMSYTKLHFTLLSAQNIGPGRRKGRVKVYAMVLLNRDRDTLQKTNVDRMGGRNPRWNREFTYEIEYLSRAEVVVYLFYERTLGDMLVGEARIPIRQYHGDTQPLSFTAGGNGRLCISYTCEKTFSTADDLHRRYWDSEGRRGANLHSDMTTSSESSSETDEEELREKKGDVKEKKKEVSDEALLSAFVEREDIILFCSVFPLDYLFSKDVLVWQWIAAELIELGEDEKIEELCTDYFNKLVDMECIIPRGYDYLFDQTKYKIGDKMASILQKMQPLEPKFERYSDIKQSHHDPAKVEHLFLTLKVAKLGVLKQYSRLQTLSIYDCNGVDRLPHDLFSELSTLKSLNLSRTSIAELPSSVQNLKELRFLDMSETPVSWLPEAIGCFTHFQTLILHCCHELNHLPKCISNLVNLRHLIFDVLLQLDSMPAGIGKLSNLITLSAFLLGGENESSVRDLKDLNKLRGSFRLLNLENIKTEEEAREACLSKKEGLKKIELVWSESQEEKDPQEEEILESLKPTSGIQELIIRSYSGGVFPSWICSPSFKELVTMSLYECNYCASLPSLGELPSLKFLTIIENKMVTEITSSFSRKQSNAQHQPSFPKLEKLRLESMSKLKKWTGLEKGDFPSLYHLIIGYCPKFAELPLLSNLETLLNLEIRYCRKLRFLVEDKLPSSLKLLMIRECPKLIEQFRAEDWSKIAHVPDVYFDSQEFHPQM